MKLKIFFSILFFLIVLSLLSFYWLFPSTIKEFEIKPQNSNFSIIEESTMQFYPNMRFAESEISYKIYDCPLQKENEMQSAFEIISSETQVLDFYEVENNEDISINCDSHTKMKEGLFIAGEGGPSNITQVGNFYVILSGNILLIRDSKCERPNVAIHELLHVLGFNHSENSNNIMYPVLECPQTIGDDTIQLIKELYSIQSSPDLFFENVSAIVKGNYLDTNISIRNKGLKDSKESKIKIYTDQKFLDEFEVENLKIGHGIKIILGNIKVPSNIKEIEFEIEYNFNELEKNNNKAILELKK